MAGTLPHLPLSTQFDKDSGRPLKGGRLVFYVANAPSSPALAYKDAGLTLPWGDRITLDGAGRVPNFYLPDGNIGVRLVSARGVIQFEESNLLVIGPSSGEGSGGGSVDPTTTYRTGDILALDQVGVREGWVRDNGRTLGSATSGATERANADCEALFLFLWNTYSDDLCPVVGGRGASAAADWAANKQITLPDKRGRTMVGVDDMGNASASRLSGVVFSAGTWAIPGSTGGMARRTLTTSELPVTPFTANGAAGVRTVLVSIPAGAGSINALIEPGGSTPVSVSGSIGGGQPHEIMQPFFTGTWYRKL